MHARRVAVSGRHVNLVELGRGPPVVLLHGLLGSPAYLLGLARVLARGRRVLVPDLPGHGRSDPLGRFSFEAAADLLVAALEAAGVRRPALLGHSFGVPLAVYMAERHDAASLVLAAPVGMVPLELGGWSRCGVPLAGAIAAVARSGAGALAGARPGRRLVFGWFVGMAYPDAVQPLLGRRMILDAAGSVGALEQALPALHALRLEPVARRVRCPTAVIWGDRDRHGVANGPSLVAAMAADAVLIPGCGHMPMLEAPYAFRAALRGLI